MVVFLDGQIPSLDLAGVEFSPGLSLPQGFSVVTLDWPAASPPAYLLAQSLISSVQMDLSPLTPLEQCSAMSFGCASVTFEMTKLTGPSIPPPAGALIICEPASAKSGPCESLETEESTAPCECQLAYEMNCLTAGEALPADWLCN